MVKNDFFCQVSPLSTSYIGITYMLLKIRINQKSKKITEMTMAILTTLTTRVIKAASYTMGKLLIIIVRLTDETSS